MPSESDSMNNLREYYRTRHEPKQPSAETLERQQADRAFFAGLQQTVEAKNAQTLAGLAEAFARRATERAAMKQA